MPLSSPEFSVYPQMLLSQKHTMDPRASGEIMKTKRHWGNKETRGVLSECFHTYVHEEIWNLYIFLVVLKSCNRYSFLRWFSLGFVESYYTDDLYRLGKITLLAHGCWLQHTQYRSETWHGKGIRYANQTSWATTRWKCIEQVLLSLKRGSEVPNLY